MEQINAWARELKTLRSGAGIKNFRRRFDAATAQQIIKSPELSALDRAAITLTIQFAAASRYDHGDSIFFTEAEYSDATKALPPEGLLP